MIRFKHPHLYQMKLKPAGSLLLPFMKILLCYHSLLLLVLFSSSTSAFFAFFVTYANLARSVDLILSFIAACHYELV